MTLVFMYLGLMIVAIAILAILFILGLTFLIVGLVKKGKAKNRGKKAPLVFIIVGIVFLVLPVGCGTVALLTGATSSVKTAIQRRLYEHPTDRWKKEWVTDNSAAYEAINTMLEAADKGDRELFASFFTEEIQNRPDFEQRMDRFWEKYPGGLYREGIEPENGVPGEASYDHGSVVKDGYAVYSIESGGQWYFISLDLHYQDTDHPEKVGVTSFVMADMVGRAIQLEEANKISDDYEQSYLTCDIKNGSSLTAKRISGIPHIWNETSEDKLTKEQMRDLIAECYSVQDLIDKGIGEPNAEFKMYNATGYEIYYGLKSEGGRELFLHITASKPRGRIIYGDLCYEDETDYDFEMCPFRPLENDDLFSAN
ncbi:MAG: DUF5104 domain-containing protein [Clostridiales bacterium]|nr:DUF5104 domain-containing protein [Clostridiales bacterium]